MVGWRDNVLRKITWDIEGIVCLLDPDNLTSDEQIFQELENRFQVIKFEEPISFRYYYESNYRIFIDQGIKPVPLVLIFNHNNKNKIPYDILNQSTTVSISFSDIFDKYYINIIKNMDYKYFDELLYYQSRLDTRIGERKTIEFIIENIFKIKLRNLENFVDIIKTICNIHNKNIKLIPEISNYLFENWKGINWPFDFDIKKSMVAESFFPFLQNELMKYLTTGSDIPFHDDDIALFLPHFFIKGFLEPLPPINNINEIQVKKLGIVFETKEYPKERLIDLFKLLKEKVESTNNIDFDEWKDIAHLWSECIILKTNLDYNEQRIIAQEFESINIELEKRFEEWIMASYFSLINKSYVNEPNMLHHIPNYIKYKHDKEKIALLVIDGMALHNWIMIKKLFKNKMIMKENIVCAWMPTVTIFSRPTIFSGKKPTMLSMSGNKILDEEKLWHSFWSGNSSKDSNVQYLRGIELLDENHGIVEKYGKSKSVLGIVINTIDNSMHDSFMGYEQLSDTISQWVKRGHLEILIQDLLGVGYKVFITSDHGNVLAKGIGEIKEGVLAKTRSSRAIFFENEMFAGRIQKTYERQSLIIPDKYLGTGDSVLIAKGLDAFCKKGKEIISHGGITLEEMLIPFIEIRGIE